MARRKVAIIAANGGLDAAYKVLNIATTAAAMEDEVTIFHTFAGLQILHPQLNRNLPAPPSLAAMAGSGQGGGLPPVPQLLDMARELGVHLVACQSTMDMMGLKQSDLIDGVAVGGAASFLAAAYEADLTLTF